jgi:hypothetical protein
MFFEASQFVPQGNTFPQGLLDLGIARIRMRSEQSVDYVVICEVFSDKLPHVPRVQPGQAIQFQAGNRSITELHLGDSRTGYTQVLGDLLLRQSARLAGPAQSSA